MEAKPGLNQENYDAHAALARADKNTKRRWNNGWKKPNWIKAGHQYNNAALLFCKGNDKVECVKDLL